MSEFMAFLTLDNISKAFGRIRALDQANLRVERGEIHALLGENGAGKTTLMNILFGLLVPDQGTMTLAGQPYRPASPLDARRLGAGMVHQHFMLVPTLTVGENILLGEQPFSTFHPSHSMAPVREQMQQFGFDLPLDRKVEDLSVGEMQRVEIFKALWKGARLLILDEPTAVLTPQETENLSELLRNLRGQGHSILFISHKLEEIEKLCDRVTILRQGKTIASLDVPETTREELSLLMMGREVRQIRNQSAARSSSSSTHGAAFSIECRNPHGERLQGNWRLDLAPGRITAIAGVEGNGQTELAEFLLGLRSNPDILVLKDGKQLPSGVAGHLREGISFISEDRQSSGLVLDFSIQENLALKDVSSAPWSRGGWLLKKSSYRHAQKVMQNFGIPPSRMDHPAGVLSGGNQQRVVVAREISRPHQLLVAANPTRGLDVGACESVYRSLLEDCERGVAVLLISTEMDEILSLADVIHVLFKGMIRTIPPAAWNHQSLGLALMGIGDSA